jgi:lysozyme
VNPSERVIEAIKSIEAFSQRAYHGAADRPGIWTMGYGQTFIITPKGTRPVEDGDTTTVFEADGWLRAQLAGIASILVQKHPSLTQGQLDGLVSFAYNVGTLALLKSTMWALIEAGNVDAAADEFVKWDHAAGVVVPGLLTRRLRERGWFTEKSLCIQS